MAGNWLNSTNVTSREDWIIIGISGVTCGGKTSLASMLREHVAPVHVFNQDRYFYPDDSPRHVRCDGLEHNNYDILGALDMEQMMTDVNLTLRGEDRAHETCTEVSEGTFSAPGKRFLVLEGFTALNYPPIMELCDLRYYLVLEYDECVRRRSLRVYEPPDVAGYFERCVWPEHVRYRAQIEKDGRVQILDGTDPYTFDAVMSDIRSYASLLH